MSESNLISTETSTDLEINIQTEESSIKDYVEDESINKAEESTIQEENEEEHPEVESIKLAKEKGDEDKKEKKSSEITVKRPSKVFRSSTMYEAKKDITSPGSLHPSYHEVKIPFHLLCDDVVRERHRVSKNNINEEFNKLTQRFPFTLDGLRLYRLFIMGMEIRPFKDPLSAGKRKRVEDLLRRS